jgi:hypothetical protein
MTAVRSSFAEVTRWNTSCCGIDPMASVIHAAANQSHSFAPPFGQNSNLPASTAAEMTFVGPPARLPTKSATAVSPIRMITVWKRSVSATDHIPPHRV